MLNDLRLTLDQGLMWTQLAIRKPLKWAVNDFIDRHHADPWYSKLESVSCGHFKENIHLHPNMVLSKYIPQSCILSTHNDIPLNCLPLWAQTQHPSMTTELIQSFDSYNQIFYTDCLNASLDVIFNLHYCNLSVCCIVSVDTWMDYEGLIIEASSREHLAYAKQRYNFFESQNELFCSLTLALDPPNVECITSPVRGGV